MKLSKIGSFATVLGVTILIGCSQNSTDSVQQTPAESSSSSQNESVQDNSMANAESNMQADSTQEASESERLGTQWGDDVSSVVTEVDLRRGSDEPIEQMQVSYADKEFVGRAVNSISLLAGKIEFSAATDDSPLSLYRENDKYYLQGRVGQAYRLIYHNNSENSYEIVASVDGLNVLNGSAASRYDTGYVVEPNDKLVIEGFRKSQSSVASFIFSKPSNAYAANTDAGSIDNTGIIGTAIYELYDPSYQKRLQPQAFPADNSYAKAPK